MVTFNTKPPSDDPTVSPCIRVCTLDQDDVCLGCYRNIDEICAWGLADLEERREILARAETRRVDRERRA